MHLFNIEKKKNPAPSYICHQAWRHEARVAKTTSRAPRSNGERSFSLQKKDKKKKRKKERKGSQSLKVDFTRGSFQWRGGETLPC